MKLTKKHTKNGAEVFFDRHVKLVSATDLHGNITHCNEAFEDISGYSRDELLGQPHSIVRHPDMPPEAFAAMWAQLKSGRPWMGLVKNRCKNGDYYWVDAYVTPITDAGKIVGYESVRSCPNRDDVKRAGIVYDKLQNKKSEHHLTENLRAPLTGLALAFPALPLGIFADTAISSVWLLLSLFVFGWAQHRWHQKCILLIEKQLGSAFSHPMAVKTYTNRYPRALGAGEILVKIMSLQAHLGAVLTRIAEASASVAEESKKGLSFSINAAKKIEHQFEQTELTANSIEDMLNALHQLKSDVEATALAAGESSRLTSNGMELATQTRCEIEGLHEQVTRLRQAVVELSSEIQEISVAAALIEQVAEKTNLLSLNAAIEAARAGEHGRGFSIVAEEVRQLANSTRESTQAITCTIEKIAAKAVSAVEMAELGADRATHGVLRVTESEDMLIGIAKAVEGIASYSARMEQEVDGQVKISLLVRSQVEEVTRLAHEGISSTKDASNRISYSQRSTDELHELVTRFSVLK